MWSCGALEGLRTRPDGETFSFENAHPAKLHCIAHFGFFTEAKKAIRSNDLSQQSYPWHSIIVADDMADEC
jgi:hypothetical protein